MIQQIIDNGLAHEIVKNYVLSLLEPNPVSLSAVKEAELSRANEAISLANGITAARFNQAPINRSSFLAACFEATYEEPIEHLIVGYGFKYGNTTKVSALHHVIGGENSVGLTARMADAMRKQTTQVHKGEVLIFHNHPKWFLNIVVNNLPLASSTDRATAAHFEI